MKTFVSNVSGKEFPESEKMHAKAIRKAIFDLIEKEHPSFNHNSFLSISELNQYRQKYISEYLLDEVGELGELEKDVLETIQNQEAISAAVGNSSSSLGLSSLFGCVSTLFFWLAKLLIHIHLFF